MSDRFTKDLPGVDDLLAPPPFGVAETTGDQLLPIATSMEQVLDEDRLPEPEPEPDPRPAIVAVAPAPPIEPVAAPVSTAVEVDEPPASSSRTLAAVAVVVVLLGVGGFVWMRQGGDEGGRSGQVDGSVLSPANAPSEGGASADSSDAQPVRRQPASSALPTDLEGLRALSFDERHAGLGRASGDVPVELHVGLDLVQAQQSGEPCRTFSDALSIIESSEDPSTFRWAVDEANVPSGADAESCKGLDERLAAAKGPGTKGEAPEPRPAARKSRGKARSKPRPSRREPAGDPPPPAAETPKKAKPQPPKSPPSGAPSVATKLDDDLRGLGE